MQACDLKSAVSEHTKHAGHSINWASVKIIGQEDHPAFMQDTGGHKHSYSATGNKPWSGLQPSLTLWNNFAASFVQNESSLMKECGWVPKAVLNFQLTVGVEKYDDDDDETLLTKAV